MTKRTVLVGLLGFATAAVCAILVASAFADTIQGTSLKFKKDGGKDQGATQETEEYATGGVEKNTVQITCTADFAISDVHVQLRDQNGQDIGGANDKVTAVKVNGGSSGKCAKGSGKADASVAAGTSFTLTVDVDTDDSTFELLITLTVPETKQGGAIKGCQMTNLFDATASTLIQTQPILCFCDGAVVRIKNDTRTALTGATISLPAGGATLLDEVTAPTGFTAAISADHTSVTLTGGAIPPGETREIVVFFESETSEVTALETTVSH